jgi:hypothetical protein
MAARRIAHEACDFIEDDNFYGVCHTAVFNALNRRNTATQYDPLLITLVSENELGDVTLRVQPGMGFEQGLVSGFLNAAYGKSQTITFYPPPDPNSSLHYSFSTQPSIGGITGTNCSINARLNWQKNDLKWMFRYDAFDVYCDDSPPGFNVYASGQADGNNITITVGCKKIL